MSLLLMLESAYFPLFTTTLLILIIFLKIISKASPNLPPGPWKLPIIGNLHQLAAGDPLPHHAFRDLAKKHGPIMYLKLGQLQTVVISSPKAAEQVLKTHDLTFAQRPRVLASQVMSFGEGSMVFSPYGEYWREIRKVCVLKLLNTKRVQFFRLIRAEEVSNLIESVSSSSSSSSSINLSEKIFGLTNGIAARAAFGNKCKDQEEFISLLAETNELVAGFRIPDLFPSIRFLGYISGAVPAMTKLRIKFGKIMDRIIEDHYEIKNPGNETDKLLEGDFIDVLLRLQQSKELDLTTDQIKDVMMDMFGGGSETTASTIEWAMSELLRSPRAMKKTQAELHGLVLKGKLQIEEADVQNLHYLKAVVKETLRLHPPAPLQPREAIERCQIGGYEFPKKTKVITNLWALGRDPESWVDAASFKPERFMMDGCDSNVDFYGFNFQYIPFGTGRRMCPGMSYAISLIQYTLSQLLFHFDWKLGDGIEPEELDMSETFGISCRRKHDLYVTATAQLIK